MKHTHMFVATLGMVIIAGTIPTAVFAMEPPRQPLQDLRKEWKQDREDRAEMWTGAKEDRAENRMEAREVRQENKADFMNTNQTLRADRQEDRMENRAEWQVGDMPANRAMMQEDRQENRADFMEANKALRDDRKEDRQGLQADRREDRMENRAEWQTLRIDQRADWVEHRAEIKERFAEQKDMFKMRLASSTDAVKARFVGAKKEVVETRLDTMYARFDGVIEKLTTLADKIETRINVVKEEGRDTTDAEAALDTAKDTIANAEGVIAETETALDEALASDSEISKEGLRELVQKAKAAIKDAHAALINTVELLKASTNE